jgi:glycosyltransferase involved in cell wall biosynthesis
MSDILLSIIIPARNEERRLPQTLEQVVQFVGQQSFKAEVLTVINASSDRTLQIAQEYASRYPVLRVLHEELPGKGRAVHKGMLAATGAYRFFADADFSMPIDEILRFIPPTVDVPIAIASREAPGAIRYNEPFYRHLTGRVFNTLIRLLVLPALQDTQCGFKLFRADAAEKLFRRQTLMGWAFDVELLYVASRLGYPILEIPIPWYFNPESKVNVLRDSWRMFFDLLTIRRNGRQGLYD